MQELKNISTFKSRDKKWRKRIIYAFLTVGLFTAFYYLTVAFGQKPEFTSLVGEAALASFALMIIMAFIIIPLKNRSQEKAKKIGQILILATIFFGTYFLMAAAANAEPDAAFFAALVAIILALLIALVLKIFEPLLWFLVGLFIIFLAFVALAAGSISPLAAFAMISPFVIYVIVYIVIFPLRVIDFIKSLVKKFVGAIKFIFSPFLKITSRDEPKK